MTDWQRCCGSKAHHCRWCGEHRVVPALVEDHEAGCVARAVSGAA